MLMVVLWEIQEKPVQVVYFVTAMVFGLRDFLAILALQRKWWQNHGLYALVYNLLETSSSTHPHVV